MEENKCVCPSCGTLMVKFSDKPALNFVCPKCGCKIATSEWDKIDLDDTIYSIKIISIENITSAQLRVISKMTGHNYIESKKLILEGNVIFYGTAKEIKEKKSILESNKFSFEIIPEYPY